MEKLKDSKYDADYLGEIICKDEPKSPIEKDNTYCCPRCDFKIVNASVLNIFSYEEWSSRNFNYCMKCGQHLDWESAFEDSYDDLS